MQPLLKVDNLHISFHTYSGKIYAVRGVSFELNEGETLAIVGESGSGKTVTSKSIMKLLPNNIASYDSGQIFYKGKELIQMSEKEMQSIRGEEIAMIFQDPMTALNPTMTVGKQVTESIIHHQKKSKKEAFVKAVELFNLVGIPDAEYRIKQYPHQFSGGMRQRVMIAMALACNPKVIIADEPTTALDVTIQAQILDLLKEIQKKLGTAIILITHDLGVVANMADRVAVMYAGKIVETGTVDEIFYNPMHPYNWGLLSSMPDLNFRGELKSIPGSPPDLSNPPKGDAFAVRNEHALKIDYEVEPEMFKISETHYAATWLLHEKAPKIEPPVNLRIKKEHGSIPKSENAKKQTITNIVQKREPLIEVRNLSKHFTLEKGKVLKAVNDVSFTIYKGETFGLVGESGCGKSTTGRTLLRMYETSSGEIYYKNEPIHKKLSNAQDLDYKRRVQMIFQDPYASLDPRKTVGDSIAEGIDIHGLAANEEERQNKISQLLEKVGLNKGHINRYPHEFSGGQRQRIGIARALAVEPEFIIADEPISALDVSIQAQVVNLMKKLQDEQGLTYLFIAHDLSMVKYLSDRIGVMYLGNIVELAESDELYENPLHPYTKALLSAIPIADPDVERNRKRILLKGDIPNPINPPPGCPFASRCQLAMEKCTTVKPSWIEAIPGHWVACHVVEGDL